MKTCSKCGVSKEEAAFSKISRYNKNGVRSNTLRSHCKTCCYAFGKAWLKTEKGMASQDKYRASIGKVIGSKRKARRLVQQAIDTKQIVKATACFDCKEAKEGLEAHHEDYDKPLDVVWVCSQCHGKRTVLANRKRVLEAQRLSRGWPAEQAKLQAARKLVKSGITPKQFELAALCAISPALLIHRMVKLGLTFNEAIALPVKRYVPFVDRVKQKYEEGLKKENNGVLPDWYSENCRIDPAKSPDETLGEV